MQVAGNKPFITAWDAMQALSHSLVECLANAELDEWPGLVRCKTRLDDLHRLLTAFASVKQDQIRWVERFKQSLVFHSTPVDIADSFYDLLKRAPCAYIFTSATLTMAGSFDCFTRPLGLGHVPTLSLPSPFDFKQQAVLYLPRGLPDPKDVRYYDEFVYRVVPCRSLRRAAGVVFSCLRAIAR